MRELPDSFCECCGEIQPICVCNKGERVHEVIETYIPRLVLPNEEELVESSAQHLHEVWRGNNREYMKFLLNSPKIPFFGIHGTCGTHLRNIEETKEAFLNIGTFYCKPKDPAQFLVLLYEMCRNISVYAFFTKVSTMDPGGILIFDVENKEENTSYYWEPLGEVLAGVSSGKCLVGLDDESDQKLHIIPRPSSRDIVTFFLEGPNNKYREIPIPWRSDVKLNKDTFQKHFKGVFGVSQASKYLNALSMLDTSQEESSEMIKRILTQEMLRTCLEKLSVFEQTLTNS